MNWVVDRRKDNYDELLLLARDSRASRARTNRWTTGLVIGAMAASGAYVTTMNQQVDDLRETTAEAEQQRDAIRSEYSSVLDERNALKSEIDAVARYQDKYAEIAPALILGDKIKDLALTPAQRAAGLPRQDTPPVTQFALSNLVWIVDGSRRFPMTAGDILWVPEGQFWVEMEETAGPNEKPTRITIHKGARPTGASTGVPFTFDSDGAAYQVKVTDAPRRGIANCIRLTWHEKSSRSGFSDHKFVDIDVLFYNHETCPDRLPAP